MTFWEHLDVLRADLFRMLLVAAVCGGVAFAGKEPLFDLVLAPAHADFVVYRLMHAGPFRLELVNVGLTEQFMVHVRTAFCVGLLMASPYLVYVLYSFVAPALYPRERRLARRIVLGGYAMFVAGVLVNYFIVFPPHRQISGHLPGEQRHTQPAVAAILRGHAADDESGLRHSL